MPAVRADNSLRTRSVKLLIMIMLDSGPFFGMYYSCRSAGRQFVTDLVGKITYHDYARLRPRFRGVFYVPI